jgi:hypothetical protein
MWSGGDMVEEMEVGGEERRMGKRKRCWVGGVGG